MKPEERRQTIQRYAERIRRLGPTVQALGWRDGSQQALRFQVLTEGIQPLAKRSLLDVGCGFGDLYDFLTERGIEVHYTGCDVSPDVLVVARERHPHLVFEERDILENPYPDEVFDYVVMSGVFNHVIQDNEAFVERMLRAAFRACKLGITANMVTEEVDYREDYLYYSNPERVLRFCLGLSRYVTLRQDYPLYEFTVFVYRTPRPTLSVTDPQS